MPRQPRGICAVTPQDGGQGECALNLAPWVCFPRLFPSAFSLSHSASQRLSSSSLSCCPYNCVLGDLRPMHPFRRVQYTCLKNSMDRGAWWAAVYGVTKSRTRLSDFTFTFMHWRRKWQPTPVFLPGESQGQGSLVGCRLWGLTESDTTEVT